MKVIVLEVAVDAPGYDPLHVMSKDMELNIEIGIVCDGLFVILGVQ